MFNLSRALLGLSALALISSTLLSGQTINPIVNFSSVAVGTTSASTTVTITAPANATFSLSYGTEFVVSPASCAGGSCAVPVVFQPAYPGVRRGAISAFSSGSLVSITPLVGLGTGQLTQGAGIIHTVATTTSAQVTTPRFFGVAARTSNLIYVSDSNNNQVFLSNQQTGQITLVAGNGTAGYSGDGAVATNAQLNQPSGLAIDSVGDLLICDTNNHVVRRVDKMTGIISTVAGNHVAGFSGDGGAATSASLNSPGGAAVDLNGNIIISDTNNLRLRQVTPAGIITTIAGNGSSGFSGDGGSATAAQLSFPIGIAVDSSNTIYFADVVNNVVRKVTSAGVITTVAGQGGLAGFSGDGSAATSALLNFPYGVAIDGAGDLYISDGRNNRIRKVTGDSSHTISTVAGSSAGYAGDGGSASAALLNGPAYLSTDDLGDLVFVDSGNNVVRSILLSQTNGLYFVPVPPCRVVDTRNAGTFGAPYLTANTTQTLAIRNSGNCPSTIPASADVQAYALNVTVVPHRTLNFLTVAPSITGVPNFSTLNARDGRTKANAAIVPANLSSSARSIDVYTTDDTELILDVFGYYVPQTSAGSLAYYPLPPCRIADTRFNNGGIMAASETRNFPIAGNCSVPASAQAYALNLTALPQGSIPGNGTGSPLPYLTAWPTGTGAQPVVSTLNATTGTVTANAAIIPAGTGGNISIYVQASTNVIIDVSGYYAPAGLGGLGLYNTSPCRAYDSRFVNSPSGTAPPISGIFSADVRTPCGLPPVSQSIVMNATVVPTASLIYLTLWANGDVEPLQSTLNAYDGAVTSNLAVVPTVDGFIASFTAAPTGLIYDVFGYFAP